MRTGLVEVTRYNRYNIFDIKAACLLTTSEAEQIKAIASDRTMLSNIMNIGTEWWLSSSGKLDCTAVVVTNDGRIDKCGEFVGYNCGVRPVLKFKLPDSGHFLPLYFGDSVKLAGEKWIFVLPGVLLCDRCVGSSQFKKHSSEAFSENDYKESDIKVWLERWWDVKKKCLAFSLNMNRLMKKKGITQIDLAKKTGIPKSGIHYYATGSHVPTSYNLNKLSEVLGPELKDYLAFYDLEKNNV